MGKQMPGIKKIIIKNDVIKNFSSIVRHMNQQGIDRLELKPLEIVARPDQNDPNKKNYYLIDRTKPLGAGSYGEVYGAYKISHDGKIDKFQPYVLKELFILTKKEDEKNFQAASLGLAAFAEHKWDLRNNPFKRESFDKYKDFINKINQNANQPDWDDEEMKAHLLANISAYRQQYSQIQAIADKNKPQTEHEALAEKKLVNKFSHCEKPFHVPQKNRFYLLERRKPGNNLLNILRNEELLEKTFIEKTNWVLQALSELSALHAKGILHLDLFERNLLLGARPDPRRAKIYPSKRVDQRSLNKEENPNESKSQGKINAGTRRYVATDKVNQLSIIDLGMARQRETDPDELDQLKDTGHRVQFGEKRPPEMRKTTPQAGSRTDVYLMASIIDKIYKDTECPDILNINLEENIGNFIVKMHSHDYNQRPQLASCQNFFLSIYNLNIHHNYLETLKTEKEKVSNNLLSDEENLRITSSNLAATRLRRTAESKKWGNRIQSALGIRSNLEKEINTHETTERTLKNNIQDSKNSLKSLEEQIANLEEQMQVNKVKIILIDAGLWEDATIFRGTSPQNYQGDANAYNFAGNAQATKILIALHEAKLLDRSIASLVLKLLSVHHKDSEQQLKFKNDLGEKIISLCQKPSPKNSLHSLLMEATWAKRKQDRSDMVFAYGTLSTVYNRHGATECRDLFHNEYSHLAEDLYKYAHSTDDKALQEIFRPPLKAAMANTGIAYAYGLLSIKYEQAGVEECRKLLHSEYAHLVLDLHQYARERENKNILEIFAPTLKNENTGLKDNPAPSQTTKLEGLGGDEKLRESKKEKKNSEKRQIDKDSSNYAQPEPNAGSALFFTPPNVAKTNNKPNKQEVEVVAFYLVLSNLVKDKLKFKISFYSKDQSIREELCKYTNKIGDKNLAKALADYVPEHLAARKVLGK